MKLVIQIPCYNEAQSLPVTLAALPRRVAGFDEVEWLVIDDGSADATAEVAAAHGVDHVVALRPHRGLAQAFMRGLEAAVRAGADVIVNTDADNQYCADDIAELTGPILRGQAELVIGARPIEQTAHFSRLKKLLQRLGSWVVRVASGTDVADAPSGFRAISRDAALRLNVLGRYTYTLETIIQAGQKGMTVRSVPVRTNPDLRPSRLVKSMRSYVMRSMQTILRIFVVYAPARFFLVLGSVPMMLGAVLCARWLILFWLAGEPWRSRTPSLVIAAILVLTGVYLWGLGVVADLLSANRKLAEDIQFRIRRLEADQQPAASQRSAEPWDPTFSHNKL